MENPKLNQTALLALMIIFAVLGGCSVVNKEIDVAPVVGTSEFKSSETHCYDILDRLGPPAQITALPGGFAWFYQSLVVKERQLGITLPGDISGLFKLALADADLEEKARVYVFDPSGRLRSHADLDDLDDVGNGMAIQFFAAVGQVVDTGYLEDNPVQQDWGFGLLEPLPQTLNAGQSLDFGTRGAELRGTPKKVGQRTLEMQ